MFQATDIQLFLSGLQGSLRIIYPELILTSLIFVLVIVELFRQKGDIRILISFLAAGLIMALIMAYRQFGLLDTGYLEGFTGMIRLDSVSVFFRILFLGAGAIFLVFSLVDKKQQSYGASGEYYLVFLGVLIGSTLLVSSVNLLSIYLSIELLSISSYILTVFNFNRSSLESGLKYLLFGGLSSGLMLYGLSLLYGFTGSLEFTDPAFLISLKTIPVPALVASLLFVLSGLFFKMSAVPFHLWTPDIYQGAPTPIVAFFSIVPKLAGTVVFIRMFVVLKETEMPGFSWDIFTGVISILTVTIGNLVAIWQTDAKRMMAYSSISHAGIILMGVIVFNKSGIDALMFYSVIYLFMNFLVFYIIELLGQQTGSFQMKGFHGLGMHLPVMSVCMVVGIIALIGLPPTAGFTGKLLIFTAVWNRFELSDAGIWSGLVFVGLINTVIALFYYLKIPYYLFFKSTTNKEGQFENMTKSVFAILLTIPLLVFFFKPDWLLELINTINFAF